MLPEEHQKLADEVTAINAHYGDRNGNLGKALLHLSSSALFHQRGEHKAAYGSLLTAAEHARSVLHSVRQASHARYEVSGQQKLTPEQNQERNNQFDSESNAIFKHHDALDSAVIGYAKKIGKHNG